ncbi:MAG: hypothetical protein QOE11_1085 [Solirubrobacteraceae bacterium]|jgi:hypothetical protein|nr:hypothetical protein [Solirubrobacteraceae bacterium]
MSPETTQQSHNTRNRALRVLVLCGTALALLVPISQASAATHVVGTAYYNGDTSSRAPASYIQAAYWTGAAWQSYGAIVHATRTGTFALDVPTGYHWRLTGWSTFGNSCYAGGMVRYLGYSPMFNSTGVTMNKGIDERYQGQLC